MKITSVNNDLIKENAKLLQRKYRDKIECAWNLGDVRYRPAPVDYTFYIGGAVLTVVYTIFTLVWGFF